MISPPEISSLILQSEQSCNLDCGYCYLPNRRIKKAMPLEVVAASAEMIVRCGLVLPNNTLHVLWHAGEPLLAGLEFYREASRLLSKSISSARIRQTFQTNGVLISDAWCDYFMEVSADIGISIDGPQKYHDEHRKRRGGQGSHAGAVRGLKLLQENEIPYGVLSVLTKKTIQSPDEIFDFYCNLGVRDLAFNVEEVEGVNLTSSLSSLDERGGVHRFFARFFQLNREASYQIRVREFEQSLYYLRRAKSDANFTPSQSEQRPLALIVVDTNGDISTFSPELATMPESQSEMFKIGNVFSNPSLKNLMNNATFLDMEGKVLEGIEHCSKTCTYFQYCGGGSPSSKYFETGRFDVSATAQCTHYRKAVVDAVLSHLVEIQAASQLGKPQGRSCLPIFAEKPS